jgi:hypothetical protein
MSYAAWRVIVMFGFLVGYFYRLNLGPLHPVACVRSGDDCRLILLFLLLRVLVIRPSSGRKYIIS